MISPEGRDSRYDSISSAIAKQVVVQKAVTPDMSGETISGNVDIITRSAFDAPGARFSGKLAYGVEGLGPQDEFEGYALLSDRWETGIGDIGVLMSGSYYARGINTDNWETDWEQVPQDTRPGGAERFYARETERRFYRATRRNYSVSGRLDWQPSDANRFYAESIFTTFNDDEQRDNYIFDLDDQQTSNATVAALSRPCPATAPTGTTGYGDICLNDPFLGTNYGVDINANFLIRRYRQSIFTNTLASDHEFGGGWGLKLRGNYTRSVDDRSAPAQFNFESPSFANAAQRPTVFYDLTNRDASFVQLYRTVNTGGQLSRGALVPSVLDFALPLNRVRNLDAEDVTKAYTGRVELERQFDFLGGESRVRLGGQYDRRRKISRERIVDRTGAQAIAAGLPGTLQMYVGSDTYIGTIPTGYDVRFFDIDNLLAKGINLGNQFPFADVTGNFYDVKEEVRTGYAIFQGRYGWGSVIGDQRRGAAGL